MCIYSFKDSRIRIRVSGDWACSSQKGRVPCKPCDEFSVGAIVVARIIKDSIRLALRNTPKENEDKCRRN